MSQNFTNLVGQKLAATDGEFGHVKDVYFDDVDWAVRYLVADTGSWLPARQVLISPRALVHFQPDGPAVRVRLTLNQIEHGPSLDAHLPVSRQFEEEYHRHHGWPCYWQGTHMWGASAFPIPGPPVGEAPLDPAAPAATAAHRQEPHLRSALALIGYQVHIGSATAGAVSDFMVDTGNWSVESIVIKSGRFFARRATLVPAATVTRISFRDSTIFTELPRRGPTARFGLAASPPTGPG